MLIEIGQNLKNQILIIDLLNLNFRKVKFKKDKMNLKNEKKFLLILICFFFHYKSFQKNLSFIKKK